MEGAYWGVHPLGVGDTVHHGDPGNAPGTFNSWKNGAGTDT